MKKKILVIALASALSACGNPTSNSAGTDQSNATKFDTVISWATKLVRGWTAKATLTIPAQGVIADALLDSKFLGGHISGSNIREYAPYFVGKDFLAGMAKAGPAMGDSAGMEGKENPYLVPVAAVTDAYRGWQISMMDMSSFGQPEAKPYEKRAYMGFQEAAVEYTNSLFTHIATTLNDDVGVLEDPETAKTEIQRIYKAIPKSTLKKMWADASAHAADRDRIADLASGKGVGWSAEGSSYSGDVDGLTWTKSGVKWFGGGSLSGKAWSIGLESSISKSTDTSSGNSQSISGSTGEKSSAGAQPK